MAIFLTEYQKVYEALKSAIISGEFSPGQRLPQRKLAERFDATTITVREAHLPCPHHPLTGGHAVEDFDPALPAQAGDHLPHSCRAVLDLEDEVSSPGRNQSLLRDRRVVFSLGVVYGTPAEQVERIPGMIREAIEEQDRTRFDRSNFQKYGDFSLVFESVYYLASPDYNVYMDTQERINLHILRRFREEGIEFAYPTRTVIVEGAAAAAED